MIISLVAAAGNNNVIGTNNQLPWDMPADMKFFMTLTKGHTVIMGRKTYESMGKPLKGRRNIVVTRSKHFTAEGCEVVLSIEEALKLLQAENEVFVIGGAQIFRHAITLADKIYLTRIYGDFKGDTFFPHINEKIWEQTSMIEHKADEKNPYPFAFIQYMRKKA